MRKKKKMKFFFHFIFYLYLPSERCSQNSQIPWPEQAAIAKAANDGVFIFYTILFSTIYSNSNVCDCARWWSSMNSLGDADTGLGMNVCVCAFVLISRARARALEYIEKRKLRHLFSIWSKTDHQRINYKIFIATNVARMWLDGSNHRKTNNNKYYELRPWRLFSYGIVVERRNTCSQLAAYPFRMNSQQIRTKRFSCLWYTELHFIFGTSCPNEQE